MRLSTIGYCFKQGFKNIWRNKLFSLASIATMAACIFMFGIFFCIVQNFQNFVRDAEEGVAVTVFFEEGISEQEILEIGEQLTKRNEVSEVVYVSSEEAWKSYQRIYFKDNPNLADAFLEDNPLANSANLEIYMKDIAEQQNLVDYISSMEHVRKINRSEAVADILTGFNRLVSYVSVAIIGLLLAVAVFLISNTVAIGISVRKEEIAIMRMVGATNAFIRWPFVYEGFLLGILSSALAFFMQWGLYEAVSQGVSSNDTLQLIQIIPFQLLWPAVAIIFAIAGIIIGVGGSLSAIRKFLQV